MHLQVEERESESPLFRRILARNSLSPASLCTCWHCRGTLLGRAQESCHVLWRYLQTQKLPELGAVPASGLALKKVITGVVRTRCWFYQAFTVPNLLGCMASCDTLCNWILLELFSLLSVGKFRTIMRVNNRKFLFYLRVCRRTTEPFPILFSENMIPSIMYYYSGRGRQWGNRRGGIGLLKWMVGLLK